MNSSLILAGVLMVYLIVGVVASETGLTEPIFDLSPPDAPADNGGFLDQISAVLAPIGWAFNAMAGLFQLATYQVDDIPPLVNTLLFAPMGFLVTITGYKLVRGGS